MAVKLDFCCLCADWIPADTGTIRQAPNGDVEIICRECEHWNETRRCRLVVIIKVGHWTMDEIPLSIKGTSSTAGALEALKKGKVKIDTAIGYFEKHPNAVEIADREQRQGGQKWL